MQHDPIGVTPLKQQAAQTLRPSLKFCTSVYKLAVKLLQTGLRAQLEQQRLAYAETF